MIKMVAWCLLGIKLRKCLDHRQICFCYRHGDLIQSGDQVCIYIKTLFYNHRKLNDMIVRLYGLVYAVFFGVCYTIPHQADHSANTDCKVGYLSTALKHLGN